MMTVQRLVNLFSCFTKLPVEVHEVRDQILEWGYFDKVIISPFSSSPDDLRGFYIHYAINMPYGHVQESRFIRYNSNLTLAWQRLRAVQRYCMGCTEAALLHTRSEVGG